MRTFRELVQRFGDAQGVPFVELAKRLGLEIGSDPARMKQFAGNVAEFIAGKGLSSAAAADLKEFDVEIKTIPLRLDGKPREPTKVSLINYTQIQSEDWWSSAAYHKLRVILFVPIVKEHTDHPEAWYIRSPFIWMPSTDEIAQLQADWEEIRARVVAGEAEALSSAQEGGPGTFLMAKTAGKNAADVVTYEVAGKRLTARRRAFFLRTSFTREVLRANL